MQEYRGKSSCMEALRNRHNSSINAGGRTRTDTVLPPHVPETCASANFATPATKKYSHVHHWAIACKHMHMHMEYSLTCPCTIINHQLKLFCARHRCSNLLRSFTHFFKNPKIFFP